MGLLQRRTQKDQLLPQVSLYKSLISLNLLWFFQQVLQQDNRSAKMREVYLHTCQKTALQLSLCAFCPSPAVFSLLSLPTFPASPLLPGQVQWAPRWPIGSRTRSIRHGLSGPLLSLNRCPIVLTPVLLSQGQCSMSMAE